MYPFRRRFTRHRLTTYLTLISCLAGYIATCVWNTPHTAAQEPKPFANQKISFYASVAHAGAAKELAEWFHADTGGVVEVTLVHYRDLLEKILQDNGARNPRADVYLSWYVNLGALVGKRALTDITDLVILNQQLLQPDDFIPTLYDAYTLYDGRRWGLPFDGDTHFLFYRKSLFAKYHLEPPETWADYLRIAKTITENERGNGIYGCAIMAHPTPILIISCFMNRLGSYGGSLMDENNRPTIDTPEARAALKDMIAQSAYALPTVTETDFAVARDAFLTGQVAMVEQWSDIGIMAEDVSQSLIKNDWGVAQMPRGRGVKSRHAPALNAGFFLAVSSKAPNPELAKAFLLYASRPDIGLRLNLINGGVDPVRKSIIASKDFKQFAPVLSQVEESIVQFATPWPVIPQTPKLLVSLSGLLVDALEKRKTAEQALKEAQRQWLHILKTDAS